MVGPQVITPWQKLLSTVYTLRQGESQEGNWRWTQKHPLDDWGEEDHRTGTYSSILADVVANFKPQFSQI
jgi:hypothetical protein